ncbi:putative glutamine synthetase [Helianthus anomalus]
MCDAYTPACEPIPTNERCAAAKIFSNPEVGKEVPWYGIEQEYTFLQKDVHWPLGWPQGGILKAHVKHVWVLNLYNWSRGHILHPR